jgi:protein-histidine pros-kinase
MEAPMKLLVKFNLVFLLIFLLGLGATGAVSWKLLERNARDEISQSARLLMDTALAARSYTQAEITPLLQTQMKYAFLPQSIPAFSAAEIFNHLRKAHAEYGYKEAVLNPTNPRNRALEWEADVIGQFRGNAEWLELVGQRATPAGGSFYVARPIRVPSAACLQCHGTPEEAPKTLVERYGPSNGFGWKVNDVVGAQIVSVPTTVPLERAKKAFAVFMTSITAVFVAIGVGLNLMLWSIVIRPIGKLSRFADRISLGELDIPGFERESGDEIGVLARSVARMRTSMVTAMKMLDG